MITADIHRFSVHLAMIYASLAKPLVDVVLYNYQLSRSVGPEGLFLLIALVQSSAALRTSFALRPLPTDLCTHSYTVRAITPSFGTYTAENAALSGALRHSHSRLSEFSEEITFLGGEKVEKLLLERDYFGLVMHMNRVLKIRLWHGIAEEGIIK